MDSKHKFSESISERKKRLVREIEEVKEEIAMSAGDGGFTGSAPAEGPVAGYDPLMKFLKRRDKKKKKKD